MDTQNDSKTSPTNESWEKPELTELDICSTEETNSSSSSDSGTFPNSFS
jgi:hypothetical protein